MLKKYFLLTILFFLVISSHISAADLSGGFTFISQSASDNRVKNDSTASVDVGMVWQRPEGRWWLYIEGNTTPKLNGVSTILTESNADAGSALDSDREGRLQISELNYQFLLENQSALTIGLLDASSYIDSSRISNDENTQFIGVSFVNNPTIEFPDYALGLVYEFKVGDSDTTARIVMTSSNGLADNPNASYSQLVDVDNPDKGAFIAARLGYETASRLLGFGVWMHTAPHDTLDGMESNERNYGAYVVSGWRWGQNALNARLGASNAKVSNAHLYAALAYQHKFKPWVFGTGLAVILLSEHADQTGRGDTLQTEVYLRHELRPSLYVTGSLQYLVNSGFDASDTIYDSEIFVTSARLSYVFE